MGWLGRLFARLRRKPPTSGLPPPGGVVPRSLPMPPPMALKMRIKERGRLITLNKEVVRSKPELRIANFLFKRGVRYVYEMPISGATPDFYLPDSNIIIEHWGMTRSSYLRRRMEKTKMYRARGYLLVETTKADVPLLEQVLELRLLRADPHVFERGKGR